MVLSFRACIHIVSTMRLLRALVIVLTALALAGSGGAWSLAQSPSDMISTPADHQHAASDTVHAADDVEEPLQSTVVREAPCVPSYDSCASHHGSANLGDSCCGADCHVASMGTDAIVVGFVATLEGGFLISGMRNVLTSRLDRPPRSVRA